MIAEGAPRISRTRGRKVGREAAWVLLPAPSANAVALRARPSTSVLQPMDARASSEPEKTVAARPLRSPRSAVGYDCLVGASSAEITAFGQSPGCWTSIYTHSGKHSNAGCTRLSVAEEAEAVVATLGGERARSLRTYAGSG